MKSSFSRLSPWLILALLAFAAGGCSPEARLARHLERAQSFFAAGRYDNAEIEYLNALRIDPQGAEAIIQLGIIYAQQGRIGRAIPFLLKGRDLDPERMELRRQLAVILLATGQPEDARTEAEFVLEKNPADAEAPVLLAQASVTPEAIVATRSLLHELLWSAPQKAPFYVALGSLDFREGNLAAAEAAFDLAKAADPKSSAAYAALGTLYAARDERDRAEEAFLAAADLAAPRSPRGLLAAQFRSKNGDLATARTMVRKLLESTPDYLPARALLAEIALAEKAYDECAASIQAMLVRDSTHYEAMLLLGRLRLAQGDSEKAAAELQKTLTLYPQTPLVHYHLARAHLTANQPDQALRSLQQAVHLAPDFGEAVLLHAGLLMRKGEFQPAIDAVRRFLQNHPDADQARYFLADAYRAQGNLEAALEEYRHLEQRPPVHPQVPLQTGAILVQQGRRSEARKEFERALELDPAYVPALAQLVQLDLGENRPAEALQRIEKHLAAHPDQPQAHLLLAETLVAQGDTERAEQASRRAIELQADFRAAYMLLARLYINSDRRAEAMSGLQELAEKNPDDIAARMLIGVMQDEGRDHRAAREAYEAVLVLDPQFGPALNNLAYLYSEHFDRPDEALELARKARDVLPQDPFVADTLGWILCKKGQIAWGLSLIQESAARIPDNAEVQYHLGAAHYMMGQEQMARAALERALGSPLEFPGRSDAQARLSVLAVDVQTADETIRLALERRVAAEPNDGIAYARLGGIFEREGALDKALAAYEAASGRNPNNVQAVMNLVRFHEKRMLDLAKAFELAKAAYKIAPGDPDVSHTLGRLAFQHGQHKWAVSLLENVAHTGASRSELLFDLALARYSVGRVADAESAMRGAVEDAATLSRLDDAQRFLEMVSLAANPAQAVAAISKVEQIVHDDPNDVPALMALGAIREHGGDDKAAQGAYEKVLTLYAEFAPASRRLALLCAAGESNDPKAYDAATKARQAWPNDPEVARALGIIVFRRGDYARAATLFSESVDRGPEDAQVMYYLGMARHKLNDQTATRLALRRALELGLTGDRAVEAGRVLADLN